MDRKTLSRQVSGVRDGAKHLLDQLASEVKKRVRRAPPPRRARQGAQRRHRGCAREEASQAGAGRTGGHGHAQSDGQDARGHTDGEDLPPPGRGRRVAYLARLAAAPARRLS